MLTRNPKGYALLFLFSFPTWWVFELFNLRTQNWIYLGEVPFSNITLALLASLSFSVVMPAVFGTVELVGTLPWFRKPAKWIVIRPVKRTLNILYVLGCAMVCLVMVWPRYFFPFVWSGVYCILEPVNYSLRFDSLLTYTSTGRWKPILQLWLGCLVCGFFWEMWNYYSYPKWIYDIPYVGFAHIFEMPLLGYLGYFTFALELYALYQFIAGVLKLRNKCVFLV
ncbi:MAG TPA: hypothetical protein VKS81_04880 [Bacteroidota bacterium]|nr:hypothetical protein [Bacteroidota bacterium]